MSAVSHLADLPFPADPFQEEAAAAVDRGESVVVCAPTGSGKTVVAEAAVARALARGKRAVYTTPLKALSNQKFGDFRRALGDSAVGLLTGDNSINGRAPVVVMTTEVLRNMMYAASPDLSGIGVVVLDEVHYLQDRARGPVWEEIIIHLDAAIPLVCLSATLANAEEFAAWIRARRGPTALVVERERPVPLESLYLLRDRWEGGRLRLLPVFDDVAHRRPNERLTALLRPGDASYRRYVAPRRTEACEFLRREGLLPAIYFIFSRAGCTAAAAAMVAHGLRLTSPQEAAEIRAAARTRTAHLDARDLAVLGYHAWLEALEAGVASHHAGLVPAFKETVEQLFAAGLVRLVFATETLALGINMPARSVVLESLSKYGDEGRELLQPGDYTQLTGRAGRRGIDRRGTAVVLHSPHMPFARVAAIASAGSHPLRSSFRPTYNMACNLVAAYPRPRAEQLLNASFAQFAREQAEAALSAMLDEEERGLAADLEAATCERGPLPEPQDSPSRVEVMRRFAASTAAGDVLEWCVGERRERGVVVARGHGKSPRLLLIAQDGTRRTLGPARLPVGAVAAGRLALPEPYRPGETEYRRAVAALLRDWEPDGPPRPAYDPGDALPGTAASCPHLERHLAAARSAGRRQRRLEALRRRRRADAAGMVPRLRALLDLLRRWGYAGDWSLTPEGERLRFIYNEMDLLVAEALRQGCFADLEPAEVAGLASAFTYEPRARSAGPDAAPTRLLAERLGRVERLWIRLSRDEEGLGLPVTRAPEAGLAPIAYRWARGAALEQLFGEEGEAVGDFVRNCRQLIDLLRQLAEVAPQGGSGFAAAAAAVDRGVVAAAGAV